MTLSYSFGVPELTDGLGFIAISMALFGIAEVISNLEGDLNQDVTAQSIGRGSRYFS